MFKLSQCVYSWRSIKELIEALLTKRLIRNFAEALAALCITLTVNFCDRSPDENGLRAHTIMPAR